MRALVQPATSCASRSTRRARRGRASRGRHSSSIPHCRCVSPAGDAQRRQEAAHTRPGAEAWLRRISRDGSSLPIRVAAVFPEPTPYRAPLLDRIAALPDIDLTVLYAADTVAGRTWDVAYAHRAVFLRGVRLPGAELLVRHDYPLTPGVVRALPDAVRPDVVVVSGWSTFAAQAAIAWCRREGCAVHPRSREPRRRASCRLAKAGEGDGRAAGRPQRVGRSRDGNARARLDARAGRRARAC